jgi:hypothetical protein
LGEEEARATATTIRSVSEWWWRKSKKKRRRRKEKVIRNFLAEEE